MAWPSPKPRRCLARPRRPRRHINSQERIVTDQRDSHGHGPLAGLRVLELGQVLAGPFAGALLAWFGADVIKVEPPGEGDPVRTWRQMHKGTSLWWYILGRNKRCITANLRAPEGRELVKRLAAKCDVLIENFR